MKVRKGTPKQEHRCYTNECRTKQKSKRTVFKQSKKANEDRCIENQTNRDKNSTNNNGQGKAHLSNGDNTTREHHTVGAKYSGARGCNGTINDVINTLDPTYA